MNTTDSKAVLQLSEDSMEAQVSKIILLPTFLVPLFMNKWHPQAAVASFQLFVDDFFQAAPNQVKRYMQYSFNYVLVATGLQDGNDEKDKTSQLAINMEEIEINLVMMQWASTHFTSVEKIASQHGKRIEKEKTWEASNITVQWSRSIAIQTPVNPMDNLGNGKQVDNLHSPMSNTCTSSKEGQQNPVELHMLHEHPTMPHIWQG